MLWVITGPTGSGKTDFALEMAKEKSLPLFNADPYQFYKELPILSNQPDPTTTPMKFLNFLSLAEPLNAGGFGRMAEDFLDQESIWVGTGLYTGAVLYGLDPDRRKGTPFQKEARVDFKMIVLDPPREELYDRLNKRVDKMIEKGALREAQNILEMLQSGRIEKNNPLLKAIGLQHLQWFLNKELDWDRAVELWKRDTRRLAKRQWTWLRKFCAPSEKVEWRSFT